MDQFEQFVTSFMSPAAMSFAGDCDAVEITLADGSRKELYDAILGPIRSTEEPRGVGSMADLSALDCVERQTVSVIPKVSHLEINDSCKVRVKQPGSEAFDYWLIDSITSAKPSLITMELKRTLRKRGPESR